MIDFEDRELPVDIKAFRKRGKVVSVIYRTPHTRTYVITWEDGITQRYKGAKTRPHWIQHIYKKKRVPRKKIMLSINERCAECNGQLFMYENGKYVICSECKRRHTPK